MTEEVIQKETILIPTEIKDKLQELGFILSSTPDSGVMWGFDGSTKYFPRQSYIREEKDGKPKIKLRIEKTTNGFILIINSIPFKEQNHLSRYEIGIEEIIPVVKEYIALIQI